MTGIQAIERAQLAGLPATVVRRRELARRYAERLAAIPGIVIPKEPERARSNWQSRCVGLPPRCDQIAVMQHSAAEVIASPRGIRCAHREAVYPTGFWSCTPGTGRCPCPAGHCTRVIESEHAQDRTIQFPPFDARAAREIERVADTLAESCRRERSSAG